MREAWRQTTQLMMQDAHDTFAALGRSGPALTRRESRLGEAMNLLMMPPNTEGQIRRGKDELRELVRENSADDLGLAARYMLGRLQQVHAPRDQGPGDAQELVDLTRDHPESVFGQMAMLKLTLHRLYRPGKEPAWPERLRSVESFEAHLSEAGLLQGYHLILARACIFFDRDLPLALRHLQRALAIGIDNPRERSDVFVQLGEVARLTGRRDLAVWSYRQFLLRNPVEGRTLIVQDRLRALEGPGDAE